MGISIAMIAATVFFFAEASTVSNHGRPLSMSGVWSPSLLQFTTCTCASIGSLFTRAQLCTGTLIGASGFWRLLIGTVCMLAFGYAGESGAINGWLGFALGMAGWGFILFEIFVGESAK